MIKTREGVMLGEYSRGRKTRRLLLLSWLFLPVINGTKTAMPMNVKGFIGSFVKVYRNTHGKPMIPNNLEGLKFDKFPRLCDPASLLN